MCGDILEFFIRPVLQHTMESLLDIGRRDETLSQEVERIEGFTCFSLVLLFCFQTVDQVDEFLECDDSITVLKMELLMSSLPSVVILRIRKICIPAESPCCGRNFGTKILKIGFQENGFWVKCFFEKSSFSTFRWESSSIVRIPVRGTVHRRKRHRFLCVRDTMEKS